MFSQASARYQKHIHPTLSPYLDRASTAVSPYADLFVSKVYTPFLAPGIRAILPASFLIPEKPKTFWSMIADMLPSPGSHVHEHKGEMDEHYSALQHSRTASAKATSSVPPAASSKMDREEMNRVREALKKRIDEHGNKAYEGVREKVHI